MAKDQVRAGTGLVIIGGSAGSLEVVMAILSSLEQGLPPIIIVLHRKASESILTELLAYKASIPVKEVEEKEAIQSNVIYVAPADYHLLIERDRTFPLDYSEKVNYSRPSIDVVFQSAAEVYGHGLTCILLSGANADGAEGLANVREKGGVTIVQDPATATVPYMPEAAIARNAVDHVQSIGEISAYIRGLISGTGR